MKPQRKMKNQEMETMPHSLLPDEVEERKEMLVVVTEKKRGVKARLKELRQTEKKLKQEIEELEREAEKLSKAIITQQEDVPVNRQMTLSEIEDRRRHEISIEQFKRESEAFDQVKDSQPDPQSQQTAITPESNPISPPDRNTVEGGLYAALHHFADAAGRWVKLRERGATDKELRDAVANELGTSGSSSGPGLKSISYKGGKDPAFWFDSSPPARPTLKGRALIEKAREVMAIPMRREESSKAEAAGGD